MFRPFISRVVRTVLVAVALHQFAPSSRAVVLGGAVATQETAPSDDPGWNNAVAVGAASGVYLGNRWVLTAAHVGSDSVTVGSKVYGVQPGSTVRLQRPDGSGPTDLVMFRLDADPGLPAVAIVPETLTDNSLVTMVGFGRPRNVARQFDFTWTDTTTDPIFVGYDWAAPRKSFGRNRTNTVVDIAYDDNVVRLYETVFDDGPEAEADEAQGAVGDSGGPVFAKVGGTWFLAGVMLQASYFEGQPSTCSIFGNATYSADLATYRTQIEALRSRATPYSIWEFAQFRAEATSDSDDPDHDGLSNFQEFAFGLDPHKPSAGGAPSAAVAAYDSDSALTLTYQRDTIAGELTYTVEVSSDLVNWTSGPGVTAEVAVVSLGGTLQRVTVRDLTGAASLSRRFMRLRIAQP